MTTKRRLLVLCGAISVVVFGLAAIGAAVGDPKTPADQVTATPDDSTASPAPIVVTTVPQPKPVVTTTKPAPPKPKPKPSTRTTTRPATDHRYSTCKEAKAHGLGPYYRGVDPEYTWYIDSDHDGIVCE